MNNQMVGLRVDGRKADELRPVGIIPGFVNHPEGSVLFSMGDTRVLCNVTIEEGAPRWKEKQGVPGGWVTAEYALLPRATQVRTSRETMRPRGRTQEIRRMIGRSLRAAVDLRELGPRTCIVDCDVLQADGGTRTAAVTGGYVALVLALKRLVRQGELGEQVFLPPVAGVSVGLVDGQPLLDLCYEEDARAEVDINVMMNAREEIVEVQGTAEGAPFSRAQFDHLIDLAQQGIGRLLSFQKNAIDSTSDRV